MSESEQTNSDELNYREAYLSLFNKVTDIIERLQEIQKEAEHVCICIEVEEILADSVATDANT